MMRGVSGPDQRGRTTGPRSPASRAAPAMERRRGRRRGLDHSGQPRGAGEPGRRTAFPARRPLCYAECSCACSTWIMMCWSSRRRSSTSLSPRVLEARPQRHEALLPCLRQRDTYARVHVRLRQRDHRLKQTRCLFIPNLRQGKWAAHGDAQGARRASGPRTGCGHTTHHNRLVWSGPGLALSGTR